MGNSLIKFKVRIPQWGSSTLNGYAISQFGHVHNSLTLSSVKNLPNDLSAGIAELGQSATMVNDSPGSSITPNDLPKFQLTSSKNNPAMRNPR